MKNMTVNALARTLRILVIAVLVVNILALFLVPGFAGMLEGGGPGQLLRYLAQEVSNGYVTHTLGHAGMYFLVSFVGVWTDPAAAFLTVFFWLCGVCTALILWQARCVLDTILAEDPFRMANARALKRAAVCCWIISGSALIRLVLWLYAEGNMKPFFTYNTLFVPVFFMAGLLFMVMSALFRQAAELKEDQDLTI